MVALVTPVSNIIPFGQARMDCPTPGCPAYHGAFDHSQVWHGLPAAFPGADYRSFTYEVSFSTNDGGMSWQPVNWNSLDTYLYCMSGLHDDYSCILTSGEPGACTYTYFPPTPGLTPSYQGQHTECTPTLPGDEGYCSIPPGQGEHIITDPNNARRQLRYQPGVSIKLSNDGGKTWQPGYQLTASEARRDYLATSLKGITSVAPQDAIIDPATGKRMFMVRALHPQGDSSR